MSIATPFALAVIEAETIQTVVTKATLNVPPAGTLMRATLGNTSIEFRVKGYQPDSSVTAHKLFYGVIEGEGSTGYRNIDFWIGVPWTFELLEEAATDAA